jgi:ABC-type nickel/cobalt efflux system permease component RcnA
MDTVLLSALALGFLSGFRHAFEPDHIIAVSTLLHDEPKLSRALRLGLAWGAGHTTTLVLGIIVIGSLRLQLSEAVLGYFELPVALMLIGLGAWAVYRGGRSVYLLRRHRHNGIEHYHVGSQVHPHGFTKGRTGWRGYCVGLMHGLAGSGALLLLVAATLPTMLTGVLYAVIFGIGSIAGMGGVTMALAMPLIATRSRPLLHEMLMVLSGFLSILLGSNILYMLWNQ